MGFFQNTAKPKGFGGKLMVKGMNGGSHAKLAEWGFAHLEQIPENAVVLDAGCGGGANIARWLKRAPMGRIYGLDYSEVSVDESKKVNAKAINEGRCEVIQANVAKVPYADNTFDYVSAFETVYFWPDLSVTFKEILRVLKPGGIFLICNESTGHDKTSEKFSKIIDGMKLYDGEMLEKFLKTVGFQGIKTDIDEKNNRLCVVARKED